MIKNWTCKSTI